MLLAFSYLFVGLAHTISCTDEAVAATVLSDIGSIPDDGPDEDGSKKSPVAAGHCYVCAPVLMPAAVPDAGPTARSVKLAFVLPKLQFEDHPRLETPPPKHLT